MQPHISQELVHADFDIDTLKVYLNWGQFEWNRKSAIESAIASNSDVQHDPDFWDLSRQEQWKLQFKQFNKFVTEVMPRIGFKFRLRDIGYASSLTRGMNPIALSIFLFGNAINELGSPAQREYWNQEIFSLRCIGSYAQTELAHGSDVQNLQTRAVFDKDTDEFVINTPTIEAAKYWPGQLAKIGNHALVMGQLIVGDKNYGQQMFVVPIRSQKDHSVLQGVQLGDIGTKYGYLLKDNGYAIFKNVRIPRGNMLMGYQELDSQGNYTKRGNPKVLYMALLNGRFAIIRSCYYMLGKGLTIALRYAAYRTQFKTNKDGSERKVLDYQLVQYRLLPYLADTFSYFFMFKYLSSEYDKMKKALMEKGDDSYLKPLHSVISGLKSFTTWNTFNGLEECRQCCGGHGFLKSAGISFLLENHSPTVTFEGDNSVMAQQTAKDLMKNFGRAMKGKSTGPYTKYLDDVKNLFKKQANIKSVEDLTHEKISEALAMRACYTVVTVGKALYIQSKEKGQTKAWNEEVQSDLIRASKYHSELFIYNSFISELEKAKQNQEIQSTVYIHMRRLAKITGLRMLRDSCKELYFSKYFTGTEGELIEKGFKLEISKVRKIALSLIQALGYRDEFLFSTIGSQFEDPYESLMKHARLHNPLNKHEVLPGVKKHILPLSKL